mmetsp:Transcript_110585/g.174776  ORF Transcript_110585/g.174776 Transcript_110585/m.174776 type:complete len:128 (-) Transcript_110585:21-404(-)
MGVKHRLEEKMSPYIADVRVRGRPQLIEIDGPLHFVGGSKRYDLKSMLKHRLLTKQGWQVHHIAWYDWPASRHSRVNYMRKLLRSNAPGGKFAEYTPLSSTEATLNASQHSPVRTFKSQAQLDDEVS